MAPIRRNRLLVFVLGVSASVAIVGVFFWLAWLLNDSAEYAWIARLLYGLFVALNPLLPLVQRALLRTFPAPPAGGRIAIQVAFIAAFLAWWWLVAVVVDRLLMHRRTNRGAA